MSTPEPKVNLAHPEPSADSTSHAAPSDQSSDKKKEKEGEDKKDDNAVKAEDEAKKYHEEKVQWLLQKRLPEKDFKAVGHIGGGQYGNVYLFEYKGKDPEYKKIADLGNGYIAVKVSEKSDNENEMGAQLYSAAREAQKNNKSTPYTVIRPMAKRENEKDPPQVILCQFVGYEFDTSKPESSDLDSFLRKLCKNAQNNPSQNKWAHVFHSDLDIMLSQIAASTHASQQALHEAGFLHFDTASRNILIAPPRMDDNGVILRCNAVITDYGHSELMHPTGRLEEDKKLEEGEMPVRYLDSEAYVNRKRGVRTDLFALKTTMIDMTALAGGAIYEGQVLELNDPKNPDYRDARKALITAAGNDPAVADSNTLKIYINNLQQMVEELKQTDKTRAAQLELYIKCYGKYMTTMPPTGATLEEAMKFDKDLLMEAHIKFLLNNVSLIEDIKNYPEEYGGAEALKSASLSIKRLLLIDNSKEFTESYTYLRLVQLQEEIDNKLKQLPPTLVDTVNTNVDSAASSPATSPRARSDSVSTDYDNRGASSESSPAGSPRRGRSGSVSSVSSVYDNREASPIASPESSPASSPRSRPGSVRASHAPLVRTPTDYDNAPRDSAAPKDNATTPEKSRPVLQRVPTDYDNAPSDSKLPKDTPPALKIPESIASSERKPHVNKEDLIRKVNQRQKNVNWAIITAESEKNTSFQDEKTAFKAVYDDVKKQIQNGKITNPEDLQNHLYNKEKEILNNINNDKQTILNIPDLVAKSNKTDSIASPKIPASTSPAAPPPSPAAISSTPTRRF